MSSSDTWRPIPPSSSSSLLSSSPLKFLPTTPPFPQKHLLPCLAQVLFNACDYWLKIWANQAEYNHWAALNASGNLSGGMPDKIRPGPFPELSTEEYLYIYVGLILSLLLASKSLLSGLSEASAVVAVEA